MRVAMQQDHPDMVPLSQPGRSPNGALQPREVPEPPGPKSPPDPEADDIAGEAAEPADRNQRSEAQRARMGGVAGKQSKQQAVRGRICEYETVGRIAVLANEVEEGCEVGRKGQNGNRDGLSFPRSPGGINRYHPNNAKAKRQIDWPVRGASCPRPLGIEQPQQVPRGVQSAGHSP